MLTNGVLGFLGREDESNKRRVSGVLGQKTCMFVSMCVSVCALFLGRGKRGSFLREPVALAE